MMAALLCATGCISAQQFFNLTAEQVKIDSLLPSFYHSHDVGYGYADSLYEVRIEYPEFIDMSEDDIRRYKKLAGAEAPEMPLIDQRMSVSKKQGSLDISFVPIVCRDGRYKKLVSFKLDIKNIAPQGKKRATRAGTDATGRYAAESVLREGSWAKIRVAGNGVHQISRELVAKAGFSNIDKVKIYGYGGALQPESLTAEYLKETDDLKQVATYRSGGRVLFYAQGPVSWKNNYDRTRNPYSDYGYYFLTENDEEPLTVDSATFVSSYAESFDFKNTLYEVDDYAWFHGGRNLYDGRLLTSGTQRDYTIEAKGATGMLHVVMTADVPAKVQVILNDKVLGTMSLSGSPNKYDKAGTSSSRYVVSDLKETNKVTLKQTSGGNVRLDYIVLNSNTKEELPDLATDAFKVPEYVYRITNQNLHAHGPADMIIILPTMQKLRAQAERIKQLHETQDSMRVRIVPADEIFNEFSSGTPDATAYRRYMKMLYDRAETEADMPKYLLLFGDGAWDNRMKTATWTGYSPDDFLLCYESENSFSETDCYVSDDFFCLLDDKEMIQTASSTNKYVYRGKPDVAVGRFPVRTEEQARVMVDKVYAYIENKEAGAWQNTIVMMGDDGNGNIHMQQADRIASTIEKNLPGFDVRRIMWDAYQIVATSTGHSYPDATRLIKQYMTNGALIMNYSGHGSPSSISHEQVLKLADFKDATSNRLPLWLTASCDIMPFDGQEENIGEEALFNPKGGAVAFYGTTRTVYSTQNELMNAEFMKRVLNIGGGDNTIGEAVRLAKNSLVNSATDLSANKLQYSLLGDPALRLVYPKLKVVVDSIGGMKADEDNVVQLKAGMQVEVKGHIERDGTAVTDYDGVVSAMVRDAMEKVVCRLNNQSDDGAETAFQFNDRSKTLFKGSDSIRNGRFAFSFAVPKDITYSEGSGLLNLYAVDNSKRNVANGHHDGFVLNGSLETLRDSIGPSVYCYLNSSSFTNGDEVNATPYFVAEINDENGINSTGNGIGHDLELIIDGEMSKTYVLNDFFEFDFGSFKSGRLGYSIPQLEPGEHKLLFRAWDILNNSTTSELTFTVAKSVKPRLFDVDCTKNPATTSTTFRIMHDRAGSEIDVVLDIFDMSGRHLWSNATKGVSANNILNIDWDLTVNGGRRLGTGVYLYRVRISCDGSSYASKAKKLIIISNK